MNGARDELLPCSRLTRNEHRCRACPRQLDEAIDLLHGRAGSEDRSESAAFPELPSEQGHLALHGTALHRFVEQHPEPTRVHRFGQIVVGAFPHGRYRRLHGGMPGEQDDHGIWIHFGKRLEKSHAVKGGHDKIGNDHGRPELRRLFKGILAIDGLLDLVAPARQQIGQA